MSGEKCSVQAVVRCRPFTESEKGKNASRAVKVSGDKVILQGGKEQTFSTDGSYFWDVANGQVYKEKCESLVKKVVDGFNLTIMAYGQTGSGKSYIMHGTEEDPGIGPQVFQTLFRQIEAASDNRDFFVSITYVQISENGFIDLLNPHGNEMKVRQHPQLGIIVEGASEIVAHNDEDLNRLYDQGNKVSAIIQPDQKAGVHRVAMVRVEQKDLSTLDGQGVRSQVNLVDLAGAETSACKGVNALLTALGESKKKDSNVLYRDSHITRLLQDALGGNSYTVMVATISAADVCASQTQSTLQLVQTARKITNQVKQNPDETSTVISELRKEITRLRTKISSSSSPADRDDVIKMEELVKDLQLAKKQSWEERERLSDSNEEERKHNLANKGILEWVMDAVRRGNKDTRERILQIQKDKDKLQLEYKEKRQQLDRMKDDLQAKIADYTKMTEMGKAKEDETKARVGAIHDLKEHLKRETEAIKDIKKRLKDLQEKQRAEKEEARATSSALKGNSELRYRIEAEERQKFEAENRAMIKEELDRMKMELEQEKAEIQLKEAQGVQYTTKDAVQLEMQLAEMKAEKSVITLQLQSLEQEKNMLEKTMENTQKAHKEEMEIQQLQHFQTFRNFREVFEEQKAALEGRYRKLLEDAIQDAVFLSDRNSELEQENQALKQELAEMKDEMTILKGAGAGRRSRPPTASSTRSAAS
ncbi:kinesin-like protein KIF13A [Branchiostoma floridae x Branchiostoma japonicum]